MKMLKHTCFSVFLIAIAFAQDVKEARLTNGIKYSMNTGEMMSEIDGKEIPCH